VSTQSEGVTGPVNGRIERVIPRLSLLRPKKVQYMTAREPAYPRSTTILTPGADAHVARLKYAEVPPLALSGDVSSAREVVSRN